MSADVRRAWVGLGLCFLGAGMSLATAGETWSYIAGTVVGIGLCLIWSRP